MKKAFYLLAAAAAVLAGCAKEADIIETAPSVKGDAIRVTADKQATKAVFENDKVLLWEAYDQIGVFQHDDGMYNGWFLATSLGEENEGQTSATFEVSLPGGNVAEYIAIYPYGPFYADVWTEEFRDGNLNCLHPTVSRSIYVNKEESAPMFMFAKIDASYANGEDLSLHFKHIAGAFKFSFTNVPEEVNQLKLTAYGKQISGGFPTMNLTADQWEISAPVSGDEDNVGDDNILLLDLGSAARDGKLVVYAPVPTGEYPKIKVELVSSNYVYNETTDNWEHVETVYWSKSTENPNTVGRSEIIRMPEIALPNYKLAGVFNGWNADGIDMEEVEGHEGWFAAKNVALNAGEGFKISRYGGWGFSYGAKSDTADDVTVTAGDEYDTSTAPGAPNFAMSADGNYDVYLQPVVGTLIVLPAGAAFTPGEVHEGWNIWGNFTDDDVWAVTEMVDEMHKVDGSELEFRVAKNVSVVKDNAEFILNLNGKFADKYAVKAVGAFPVDDLNYVDLGGDVNISIAKAGAYDIYFYAFNYNNKWEDQSLLLIMPAGKQPQFGFALRGSFDDWGDGVEMVEDNGFVAANQVALGDNVEFLVRMYNSWTLGKAGTMEDKVFAVGEAIPLAVTGSGGLKSEDIKNIKVETVAGTLYDVIGDGQVAFVMPTGQRPVKATGWNLIGIGGRWDDYGDIPMTDKVVDNVTYRFVGGVECAADDEFKFRKDAGWQESAGWQNLQTDGKGYPVAVGEWTQFDGRDNVRIAVAGSYDFYFDPETKKGIVVTAGADLPAAPKGYMVYVLDESGWNEFHLDIIKTADSYYSSLELTETETFGSYTYRKSELPIALNNATGVDFSFSDYSAHSLSSSLLENLTVDHDFYFRFNGDRVILVTDPADPEIFVDNWAIIGDFDSDHVWDQYYDGYDMTFDASANAYVIENVTFEAGKGFKFIKDHDWSAGDLGGELVKPGTPFATVPQGPNIIINTTGVYNISLAADLATANVELVQTIDEYKIYVLDESGWTDLYFYGWYAGFSDIDNFFGTWPGMPYDGTATFGNFTYRKINVPIKMNGSTVNLILTNNLGDQLEGGVLDNNVMDSDKYFRINGTDCIAITDPGNPEEIPTPPANASEYSLIGWHSSDNWTTNVPLIAVDGFDGWYVAKGIGANSGNISFKFRKGSDWSSQIAAVNKYEKTVNTKIALRAQEGGVDPYDITLYGTGSYDVYFNQDLLLCVILVSDQSFAVPTEDEQDPSLTGNNYTEWSIIGDAVGGWNNENDVMFDSTLAGDYVKAANVTLQGEKNFKFRRRQGWTEQLTQPGLRTIGERFDLVDGNGMDNDMQVAATGTYDVYLAKDLSHAYILNAGDSLPTN